LLTRILPRALLSQSYCEILFLGNVVASTLMANASTMIGLLSNYIKETIGVLKYIILPEKHRALTQNTVPSTPKQNSSGDFCYTEQRHPPRQLRMC
jgi:hypothetical protein